MGYTTEFDGSLKIEPPLTKFQFVTINDFSKARHDPANDKKMPGYWCQWTVTTDESNDDYLEWDGMEKFYNYKEWLLYLLNNFFIPWGCVLNGKIIWQGERIKDRGRISVENNVVTFTDLE